MSLIIANALYDIFVKELRARESTRQDFCDQYERELKEIPVYFATRARGAHARAWYSRKPGHLGEIMATNDLQGTNWANKAVTALENKLARMSPLDRMAWFAEGESVDA